MIVPEQMSLLVAQPRRVCFFATEPDSRHRVECGLDLEWSVCPGETVPAAREWLQSRGVQPVRLIHPAGARDEFDPIDLANLAAAGWRTEEV